MPLYFSSLVISDEGCEDVDDYYTQYGDRDVITEHDRRKTKVRTHKLMT